MRNDKMAEPIKSDPVKPLEQSKPVVLVSHIDAYISERMRSAPQSLEEVEAKDIHVKERQSVLELPKELESYKSKFGFRWLNKNKRAIDYALNVRGWVLVNRFHFKGIPDYLFSATGSIEQGDCILAFMPKKRAKS